MNNDIKNKIIYYLSFGITCSIFLFLGTNYLMYCLEIIMKFFRKKLKILKIILNKKLKFMLI